VRCRGRGGRASQRGSGAGRHGGKWSWPIALHKPSFPIQLHPFTGLMHKLQVRGFLLLGMSRSPLPGTPQRVTRSKSSQPPVELKTMAMSSSTAPGTPVPARNTSINPSSALGVSHPSNPFEVDFVIPFSIAVGKVDRVTAQNEIRASYEELLRALEGEGGLRVATKAGRGKKGDEQVWVFVGAGEEKVTELVEREKWVHPWGLGPPLGY